MAKLPELIPYLEKGYTLGSQAPTRETLTPQSSRQFVLQRQETKERRYPPKYCTLAEVRSLRFIWEWGVLFMDEHKVEHLVTRIQDIEQAIAENRPHATWGKEPK